MKLKKYIKIHKKGFTLIEVLLSIIICTLSLQLISSSLLIIKSLDFDFYTNEDDTFLYQMQLLFALSTNHRIEDHMLYFQYKYDEMNYEFYDQKLILKDGYQVFLKEIKNTYFTKEGTCFYINYERKENKKRIIGCE